MRVAHISTILAGSGLAQAAVAVPNLNARSWRPGAIFKRWDYDVCLDNCALAGVPMPDKNTFGLPLEGFWAEQCPPTYVGSWNSPLATSRVCLDFVGTYLYFNFSSFPGYTIKSATVTWKVKGNIADSAGWTSPPPTTSVDCGPSSGGDYVCRLAFSEILQVPSTTRIRDLMAGMCPNTDREALGFYLEFSGEVEPVGGGAAVPFNQQYPCKTRAGRTCTAWDTSYPYIEVAYRCTNCHNNPCPTTTSSSTSSTPTTSSTSFSSSTTTTTSSSTSSTSSSSSTTTTTSSSTSSTSTSSSPSSSPSSSTTTTTSTTSTAPPPSLKTCDFGTAFGYQNPVGGVQKSVTLDTQSGQGCNRWGWYETPSLAELQAGISGPLYVGAGGNDITKAVDVGIWMATANALGHVTVTYLLNPPYALAQVHVDLDCLPIDKCAPGTYTYNAGTIPNLPTWSNPTPLIYPACSGGSKVALIIHANVNILTVTTTCPPQKAT